MEEFAEAGRAWILDLAVSTVEKVWVWGVWVCAVCVLAMCKMKSCVYKLFAPDGMISSITTGIGRRPS